MESIIAFFEDVPTTFRAGILIGGIFLFWVIKVCFLFLNSNTGKFVMPPSILY